MIQVPGNNNLTVKNLKNRYGFTLIELIIVIAIIIILTGIAIPVSANYINERQVYNAATQIQQDILLIQNKAITYSSSGNRFVMRFYLDSNTIAYQLTENASPLPTSNPTPGNGIIVRKMSSSIGFPAYFGETSPESIGILTSPATKVTNGYIDLRFDNQGIPYWSSNGGTFTSAGGYIILVNSSLSKQIKVEVTQIGRVKIDWITK
jgi:prepilin-type N-terminal cleavage/methylation domain-containing protein